VAFLVKGNGQNLVGVIVLDMPGGAGTE